jgi:hypothetical protein
VPDARRPVASRGPAAYTPSRAASRDARLAAALAPVLRHHRGSLAVGIADPATGDTATYHGGQPFDTASIVKADILAVLLLQHQQLGTTLSPGERDLAAAMIDDSDNRAATALWDAVERAPGMLAGNAVLGLHATMPAADGTWGLTTTTAGDQLRLLADLTSPRSPLSAPARAYELNLMRAVEPGQAWGVTAAASARTRPAVKNGWLPADPNGSWVINSIGVVSYAGLTLLIAVLSAGQPSQPAGIRLVQAAATAAAAAITGPLPGTARTARSAHRSRDYGDHLGIARALGRLDELVTAVKDLPPPAATTVDVPMRGLIAPLSVHSRAAAPRSLGRGGRTEADELAGPWT